MLETFKAQVPHSLRHFDREHGRWFVEKRALGCLQSWLTMMQYDCGADVEWSGESSSYRTQNRQTQSNALKSAYSTLHLLPTVPPELVTSAYRTLAKLFHPDKGGDTEAMQRINSAYAALQGR